MRSTWWLAIVLCVAVIVPHAADAQLAPNEATDSSSTPANGPVHRPGPAADPAHGDTPPATADAGASTPPSGEDRLPACSAALEDGVFEQGSRGIVRRMTGRDVGLLSDVQKAFGHGGDFPNFYVLAIAPDGRPLEPPPERLAEDKPLVVVFYHPGERGYDLTITGCQPTPVRVLGSLAAVRAAVPGFPGASAVAAMRADVTVVGRCSADSAVTITATVPAIAGYCAQQTQATVLRTQPVYRFTVTVGALAAFGEFHEVGVTPGIGGAPGQVFDRTTTFDFSVAAVITYFPFGYQPNAPFDFAHRVGIGTSIPITTPFSSVNLMLSLVVLPGLQFAIGAQFLHRERVLDDGLTNGSVFNDDSSTVPTHDEWRFSPGFVAGVSVGTDLLTQLLGH